MRNLAPMLTGLATVMLASGCAVAPAGPTVAIAPGPSKNAAEFQNDVAVCRSTAQQQIGPALQQLNNQAAASVILGGTIGAANAGASGDDTGAGATYGAVAAGGQTAAAAQASLQQQYDAMYAQCMYARGNVVPGYETAPAYVEAPAGSGLVRAVQRELIRLGYLGGPADGVPGARTRDAISRYEGANRFAVDGTPSRELLASLRSSTSVVRRSWVTPTTTKASARAPPAATGSPRRPRRRLRQHLRALQPTTGSPPVRRRHRA